RVFVFLLQWLVVDKQRWGGLNAKRLAAQAISFDSGLGVLAVHVCFEFVDVESNRCRVDSNSSRTFGAVLQLSCSLYRTSCISQNRPCIPAASAASAASAACSCIFSGKLRKTTRKRESYSFSSCPANAANMPQGGH